MVLLRDIHYRTMGQMPWPEFMRGTFESIVLRSDEHFMLGDNSIRSKDSRFWGPVTSDLLIGVPKWIYWPPRRWHEFR